MKELVDLINMNVLYYQPEYLVMEKHIGSVTLKQSDRKENSALVILSKEVHAENGIRKRSIDNGIEDIFYGNAF
uniref:Uncharacterized protein n=1 Tax=Onchocerca volvulus TaxID=6282 RepID=A0A8R1TY95_ONCVO